MMGFGAAELAAYDRDGFAVLRGFFSPQEIALAAAEAERLREWDGVQGETGRQNLRCRWQNHVASGELLLDTLDPVVDLSPALAELARGPKMQAVLREIYGEPGHLFRDKLIYKPAGALGHALHQDYIAWPGFPRTFLTALIAIDPSTSENGCLEMYAGYHRRGPLSPTDGDYHDLPDSLFDPARKVPLPLEPGDVAIFGCFLPHGSGINRSLAQRRHLYFSYNAASEGGDRREAHYREFHAWLRQRFGEYGSHKHVFI